MTTTLLQRLDQAARYAAPAAITLFVVLLGVVPIHAPFYPAIAPMLVLMPVYFWTVHRPDLLPFPVTFAAGLLHDALTGAPLGLHAIVLLFCQGVVLTQRRFLAGKSFFVLWWGFLFTVVVATTLEWVLFGLYHAAAMPAEPVAFKALLTTALFPLPAWLFSHTQRSLLSGS
ncbi:MAG: rod shape-determining protein MreD [Azospirillaceae bacterium]